jgi:hypothetical protein
VTRSGQRGQGALRPVVDRARASPESLFVVAMMLVLVMFDAAVGLPFLGRGPLPSGPRLAQRRVGPELTELDV